MKERNKSQSRLYQPAKRRENNYYASSLVSGGDDEFPLFKEPSKLFIGLGGNIAAGIFVFILILVAIAALIFVIVNGNKLPTNRSEMAKAKKIEQIEIIENHSIAMEPDPPMDIAQAADMHNDVLVEVANAKAQKLEVKAVVSGVDDEKYYVAQGLPDEGKVADRLADLSLVSVKVLNEIKKRLEKDGKIFAGDKVDITTNMEKLLKKHYDKHLNLSEYNSPDDQIVGSSSNKGELIEICIRHKKDPSTFNSINTTRRVFLHELAHSADFEYRKDGLKAHGPVFKRLHMYLLSVGEDLGLYSCEEYQQTNGAFCGLRMDEKYCSQDNEKLIIDSREDNEEEEKEIKKEVQERKKEEIEKNNNIYDDELDDDQFNLY